MNMKTALRFLLPVLALPVLVFSVCNSNKAPDVPEVPAGPTAVAPGDTARFKVVSADPEGLSVTYRFVWSEGDTSGWSWTAQSGDTATVPHVFDAVGLYVVRAQARDPEGVTSFWSEPLDVRVGNPPRDPTRPEGTASGWIDSSYSYSVVSTDLDLDDIRYVFDWGDGTMDTTGFHESGEFVTGEHAWAEPDSYDVTVLAIDAPGLPSEWSEVLRVAIRDPLGAGVEKWRFRTGGPVMSSPAVGADGRVYIGSADSGLYALNPDSTLAWRFAAGGEVVCAPAIGPDGTVYFGALDGKVYAVGPTGTESWTFQTGGEVSSSPALGSDGTVYVGSADRRMYAITPAGAESWHYETGDGVVSSPAVGQDGRVYFGSLDSFVYAVDNGGTLGWRYRTGGPVQGSPAIRNDGTVFITSLDGYLYALNPDSTLRWRYEVGDSVVSSPAVASDGTIFVGSDLGFLFAFYSDGVPIFQFDVGFPVFSSPAVNSDNVVLFGAGTRMYAVNALGSGTLEWSVRTMGPVVSSPTVANDGTVFFGSGDGMVYSVRGTGKLDNGAWPKFRRGLSNTGRAGGL